MSTTRNIFRSSVSRTGFMVIYAVISFFFMPFLVSHLGERWYGIWILVTGLVANSYLLDIGMATAVTRYVAKHVATRDSQGANEVINTCLVIYSVLAVAVMVLTVGMSLLAHRFVSEEADLDVIRAVMILIGLQYAAEFPFKAFAGVVSSYVRYDLLVLSRLLNVVLSISLMVYFVRRGHGILSMAIIVTVVDQLSNFLYYRIAKHLFRDLEISRKHLRRGLVRELFSYSTWSFLIQIANQLRFRMDSLVIGWMISASAVTFYAVGLRLVEYFVDFVLKATNMMTPIFTRYYFEKNYEEIRAKYLFLTRINTALGLFCGGMLVILGKAFIIRWMGPEFERSYAVMVILAVAMTAEVIGVYSDNILYAVAKHKYLAVMNLVEAVLNLALSIVLARSYGIVGVALGTALPLLVFRLIVIPAYLGRTIELSVWRFYRSLLPLAGFTLVYLGAFGFLVRPFLEVPTYPAIVLAGIAGLPLYLLLAPYIGFNADERSQLHQAVPQPLQRFTAPLLSQRATGL